MADVNFTSFTQITAPDPTTYLVGYKGVDEKRILIEDLTSIIQLDVAGGKSYSAGQLHYDAVNKCITADTGYTDVRTCIGQEIYIPFFNNTGGLIANGTPVAGAGTYASGIPECVEADADNVNHVFGFLGVATHDVADGTVGLATRIGAVNHVNTSLLSQAPVYLASGGGLTNTLPTYPTYRLLIGGATVIDASNGVIGVDPKFIPREPVTGAYFFTSSGVGSGTYWEAGYYDWATADANLSQALTSVTYGTTGNAKAAHVGIVPAAAGTVDVGKVGIRVTGTLDSETGTQTAAQTEVITDDITTLSSNTMVETTGKFSGQVTIELYISSTVPSTPTTYSLDFNYGFSKYEDFQNQHFTVTGFQAKWRGGANDTGTDIVLYHHKSSGWTYAATGFIPGDTPICQKSVDQAIAGNVANGKDGAYKRVDLDTSINGSGDEGVIVKIITTAAATFQTLDIQINGQSEEI